MIEKRFKSDLSLRRYRLFKSHTRGVLGLLALILGIFFSFTAEFWSNNKPLLLKYHERYFFPVFRDYHPSVFDREDIMVMDYRALEIKDSDFVIWPVNQWNPFESNEKVDVYPSKPTSLNWMGTDDRGRDVFARLLYGFRYAIAYSLMVWSLSMILSIIMGGFMGYRGGWVDLVGQRIFEIWDSIPVLLLLIMLVAIFKPSLTLLVVLTSIFGWVGMSRYVRGDFLKNRNMDYVEAARNLGAGTGRLLFIHILPNSLVPIIALSPFIIAGHVTGLTSLDYLGFGLSPPTPSWGELLNQAQKYFTSAWWLAVYPSIALFLTLTCLVFLGEAIRYAFDPRALLRMPKTKVKPH